MENIFDIKDLENYVGGDFIFYPIYFLLFYIIFYYILDKYFIDNKKNINKLVLVKKNNKNKEIKYKFIILDKLLKLELKSEKITKSMFYFELNELFRDYIGYLYGKKFLRSTLDEIKLEGLLNKKNNSSKIILLFESSYNEEFSNNDDSILKRKKILNNFIEYLK